MISMENGYIGQKKNWFEFDEKLTEPTFTGLILSMRPTDVNNSLTMPSHAEVSLWDVPFLDQHGTKFMDTSWLDRQTKIVVCNSFQTYLIGLGQGNPYAQCLPT